jgi:hypothetical protein
MLKVLSEGDGRYRLEDSGGASIGWIRGSAIGFRGFVTEIDARDAAVAAWRSLSASLRGEYPGWPHHEPAFEQMRTIRDGAYEWFSDGTVPIARLLRPHGRAYDSSYGIELVLPSYATEGVAITASPNLVLAIAPFRDTMHAVVDPAAERSVKTVRTIAARRAENISP